MPGDQRPILLITHTDRDGLLSGAALLRSLERRPSVEVLITQGSYLAAELEDLDASGCRFEKIYVTDTYWHPPHADRVVSGLQAILSPGGSVAWIDHHPSSVEHEEAIRARLALSAESSIIGDRAGKHEAVSIVAAVFDLAEDPVVSSLLKAVANGWTRNGGVMPEGVAHWMDVVDGLSRCPDLPAEHAGDIVRGLACGFEATVPDHLKPLGEITRQVRARTNILREKEWLRLPTVDGGWGVFLDLHDESEVNTYELAIGLYRASGSYIDYFITQENPSGMHYVSGPSARRERDALEGGGGLPPLRVSTMHKGRNGKGVSWRTRHGIDLAYLTRRQPASDFLGPWIDAHPYIVKAPWRRQGNGVEADKLEAVAGLIGESMRDMLNTYGWCDADRCRRTWKPVVEG